MPKIQVTYILPRDNEEFGNVIRAKLYKQAIDSIYYEIFAPVKSFGYDSKKLQAFIDSIPDDNGRKLIEMLEEIYQSIIARVEVEDPRKKTSLSNSDW